ncbi:MAG: YARHG domain-containing protein [Ruminococcus sp.]|nr:YARHG domain-containing protein [Ruminococcus sp.]
MNKNIVYIMISFVILSVCACGGNENVTKPYNEGSALEYTEKVSEESKTETLINMTEEIIESDISEETDVFTYEMAVEFIKEADDSVHEFMGVTKEAGKNVYSEKEIYDNLEKYFEKSIIDYVLYVYQIIESESGYTYTPYDEYSNYWIDTSVDMTLVSETEGFMEIGVTFKHVWQNGLDEEIVPVRLEKMEKGWKITDISQWYNDFRYEYMPYILFDPPYFTEEIADELIKCFGTDEKENKVLLIADTDENGYILGESSERIISEDEIGGLSKYELFLAVQEIYARHGKKFSDPVLYWRFTGQDWYEPYHAVFSQETLSNVEERNIQLLIEKGRLGKEADSGYGSLYPVTDMEDRLVSEEEAACMVYRAFEMTDKVIAFDEKNLIEEESQDVIQVYSLGEYSDEEILRDYLSEWFDNEVFDYLTVIYSTWNGLYKENDGKYTISRECTYGGDAYVPYFFQKAVIQEADEEKLIVEMPFYYHGSSKTEPGKILFEKREENWIITFLSIPYYDELLQRKK